MTLLDDFLADPASRFASVAMADTNGLLRGQMVSASARAASAALDFLTRPALSNCS